MTLSCECPEYDGDPYSWCYIPAKDFDIYQGKRRKRCSSCNELIDIGSSCLEFQRMRSPRHEIEENIWGEEVFIASDYMCEKCGEIYFNLEALGYCFSSRDNMNDALKEYWKLTGFDPEKYKS